MANLSQLEQALRRADAEGNEQDARMLAAEIQKRRAADGTTPNRRVQVAPIGPIPGQNPTQGMSGPSRYAAGAASTGLSMGHGALQAATLPGTPIGSVLWLAERGNPAIREWSQKQTEQQRKTDAPLMDTPGGFGGAATSVLASMLLPGLAATRYGEVAPEVAAGVRAAAFPTTVRGASAQGGALGFAQPTGNDEISERATNAVVGGGSGFIGSVLPRVVIGGARTLSAPLRDVSRGGVDRRVVDAIRAEADNPHALMQEQPSIIPGVQRSFAEETRDAGIARLERNSRSTGKGWDALDRSNNSARTRALETISGTPAEMEAAVRARATASNPLRKTAMAADGVDTNRLIGQIKRLEGAQTSRPAVQSALAEVRELLTRNIPDAERMKAAIAPLERYIASDRLSATNREAAKEAIRQIRAGEWPAATFGNGGPGTAGIGASYDAGKAALADARKALGRATTGHDQVRVLYNARKSIGDMLDGNSGNSAAAKAATRELMIVRDQLDRVIARQVPEYSQYLDAYRKGSVPINRMQLGNELIDRGAGSQIPDTFTGDRQLTPAAFSRATNDMDAVAAKATGFRKAKADNLLRPEDQRVIAGVQDDLERRAFASRAGSGGNSHTYERGALDKRLAQRLVARIPGLNLGLQYLEDAGNARMQTKLAEVLSNPAQARALLERLPPQERALIEDAVRRTGGPVASVLALELAR